MKYYLYGSARDVSEGFRGLSALVRHELKRDPIDGNVYILVNRQRHKIKLVVWDRPGFGLCYERLEAGTGRFPHTSHSSISWNKLWMILVGISLDSVRQRKRYYRE